MVNHEVQDIVTPPTITIETALEFLLCQLEAAPYRRAMYYRILQ